MLELKKHIVEGLNEYLNNSHIPWHMPGHKRKCVPGVNQKPQGNLCVGDIDKKTQEKICVEGILNQVSGIDVTEVYGLDDLHHPQEIIKKSMDELKKIYGTKAVFYLVNGSTCGIFAAVTACVNLKKDDEEISQKLSNQDNSKIPKNSKSSDDSKYADILIARNCHKSVYNIIEILGLKAVYVEPKLLMYNSEETTIYGGVDPDEIKKCLHEYSGIKCVVLTSPTYEGIVSDIEKISEITKTHGIPLIVDEAHGAHLPFATCGTVKSAICCGADIVIESLHKTLPALTQTALLHVVEDEKLIDYVKKYLSFYMTSSPSYVFMASMENAINYACEANWEKYFNNLRRFRTKAKQFKNLKLLESDDIVYNDAAGYDETRIVFLSKKIDKNGMFTGSTVERMLAKKSGIVCEMSGAEYIVLISTIMDTENDFDTLYNALCLVDSQMDEHNINQANETDYFEKKENTLEKIKQMEGKEAGGKIYVYPPGIPIVAKGEIITKEHIATMEKQVKSGKSLRIEGI